jgi:RNA polymerase sigma factor (sigma-70 family)
MKSRPVSRGPQATPTSIIDFRRAYRSLTDAFLCQAVSLRLRDNAQIEGWTTRHFGTRARTVPVRGPRSPPCVILTAQSYTTCMEVAWGPWAGEVQSEAERFAHGLRRRDVRLLGELIEQYQYRLVRYFVHLTGRRDLADDLVQDTWLRILERGSQYDGHSRFEPWLFAIARNLAIDSLRRPASISLHSDESERGQGYDSPSTDASPFEQAARSEDAKRLVNSYALRFGEPVGWDSYRRTHTDKRG